MARLPCPSQTIASLRIDLQRLEFAFQAAAKDLAVEELKCVLLAGIAALKAESAMSSCISPGAAETASTPARTLTLTFAELQALEEATVHGLQHKVN